MNGEIDQVEETAKEIRERHHDSKLEAEVNVAFENWLERRGFTLELNALRNRRARARRPRR